MMNGPLTDIREQIKYIVGLIKRKRDSNYIKIDKKFDKGISHYFPAKYSNQHCCINVLYVSHIT
jgi:hypothetical protein